MINLWLPRKKSKIEHRSSNISHPGENVACAQPSVSHEEEEIQNTNFEYELSKHPSEDPEEDDRKSAAKRIKKEPEDGAQSWAQEEQIEKPTPKPWEDKKDYEAIFRKFISIGDDGEEHYDVIDMEMEVQRAMKRITDNQEIVKQYQKVARDNNNFMKDYPWKSTGGLLAAKMVIRNPEEVNAAIVNGKQSKEYFDRVTGHAGHHFMDATAKYYSYKVNLTGKVNNCLSCSLEKIRQKNIPKKNEDKSKNPGERMFLDISSIRKPSMAGRQHWVMLVNEATKYKKSFFLKKKNEQVDPIIDWIKALKARHEIQVKIIRCDNAGETIVLERVRQE